MENVINWFKKNKNVLFIIIVFLLCIISMIFISILYSSDKNKTKSFLSANNDVQLVSFLPNQMGYVSRVYNLREDESNISYSDTIEIFYDSTLDISFIKLYITSNDTYYLRLDLPDIVVSANSILYLANFTDSISVEFVSSEITISTDVVSPIFSSDLYNGTFGYKLPNKDFTEDIMKIDVHEMDHSRPLYISIQNADVFSYYYAQGFSNGNSQYYDLYQETLANYNSLDRSYTILLEQYNVLLNSTEYSFSELFWSISAVPFGVLTSAFNVNVLGVNLRGIITGLFTALLLIWLIKKLF